MDKISNRHHATLCIHMGDRNQNQSGSARPEMQGRGAPSLLDVVAAAVEHGRIFTNLVTLQAKASAELEVTSSLDRASPGAQEVLEAAHSAFEVASLAVRLLEPSQRESSYRAFSDLYSALERIHDLRIGLAEGHTTWRVDLEQAMFIRRCSDIESEVIASVQAYTRVVIPQLLTRFFDGVEPLEAEKAIHSGCYDSARAREVIKRSTGHAVLTHPDLRKLPALPSLERLVIQGVVGFELLSSLTDQLLAAPRPIDVGALRDVLEEFMGVICEARGCYERSYEGILGGLPVPDHSRFKQIVAPLDELLQNGHRRFVTAFQQAQ